MFLWSAPLPAPFDDSTRLMDIDAQYLSFWVPKSGYRLDCYRGGRAELSKYLVPVKSPSLCSVIKEKMDTLTIDGVFRMLEAHLASCPDDRREGVYQVNITAMKTTCHLVSRLATTVFVYGNDNVGSSVAFYHMGQIMEIPKLKKHTFLGAYEKGPHTPHPFGESVPALEEDVTVYWGETRLFAIPPRYEAEALGGSNHAPVLSYAGHDLGWRHIWIRTRSRPNEWCFEDCLAAGYFADGQNPLSIKDVQFFGVRKFEQTEASTSPENGEADVPAKSKVVSKDFGAWLDAVTHAVRAYQDGGYVVPQSAHDRLKTSLMKRIEDVNPAEHAGALDALMAAVPTLKPLVNLSEDETLSPLEVFKDCPPEMWLEVFDYLNTQGQANAIVACPFLRQHLGLFLKRKPALVHLIPMIFCLHEPIVLYGFGSNYIDLLDASALNLNVYRRPPPNRLSLGKVKLPGEERLLLRDLAIHRLSIAPTKPRAVKAHIDITPCEREEGQSPVVAASLTLSEGDQASIIGPLYLEDVSTLPPVVTTHPDFTALTKVLLPHLALCEIQKAAMADAGIHLKQ